MKSTIYIISFFAIVYSPIVLAEDSKISANKSNEKSEITSNVSEIYDININHNWQISVLIKIENNNLYIPLKYLPSDLLGNLTNEFLVDYKNTTSLKVDLTDVVERKDDLLTLSINLPEKYFKSQIIILKKNEIQYSTSINALYANYEFNFNPTKISDTQATLNINWADKNQSIFQNYYYINKKNFVRLNSVWQKQLGNNTLVLGDTSNNSLSGLNSYNFLGVKYSSPYYNNLSNTEDRLPIIALSGFAVNPTKLDLYINNQIIQTKQIESGKYNLSIPYQSGGYGVAQAYVYDITGKPTIVSVPFYSNSEIIKKGDNEYDLSAGFIRKDYGIKSFSYGDPVISTLYKGGWLDNYTQDIYGQFSKNYSAISSLSHWIPYPQVGVVNAGITLNSNKESLYRVGLERATPKISFGLDYQKSNQFCFGFEQKCLLSQKQVFAGFPLPKNLGSINFNYIDRRIIGEENKITNFQWSKQLSSRLFLNANFSNTIGKGLSKDNKTIYFGLSYVMNARTTFNTSYIHDLDGYNVQQAFYRGPNEDHPEYGYGSVTLNKTKEGSTENIYYGADLSKIAYQVNLGKSNISQTTANVVLSGGVSYIPEANYMSFSKPINRGLTYVKIDNINTPVDIFNQNHLMGSSDKKGNFIITDSSPLNTQTVTLDVNKLPPDITLEDYKIIHTVPYSGVSKILFKAKILPYMITIKGVKAGTIFSINNDFYVVGNNGETSIDTTGKAIIETTNNKKCELDIIKSKNLYSCVP